MLEDIRSLIPDVNRRQFVVTTLAAGFAMAVRPVRADAIKTDSEGLEAGEVKIPVADGEVPAYRAMPSQGSNFPVVLVVQEIFGVHEHIRDVCRRFAKLGYLAIAPELYARQGNVHSLAEVEDIIRNVASKVPDKQVMSDLDATVAWAKQNKGDTSRLAVTGFCWGGRIVWLYAAHNPDLKTGVAWYGRLTGNKDELHPEHPIDVAAKIKQPILGLYGGADGGIPADSRDQMTAALKAAGNDKSEIHVYPDAPHAFHADYRPSYRKEAAEDGWKRLQEWFKKNGV
jgi:carboxymethylenebutenolidase